MAADVHELAPHHLPMFVPAADGSDPLMTIVLIVLIVGILFAGAFYLYLHSLPERLAHRHHRVQFELVAVMALIALFTHNNVFWVAALLIAFVPMPNFYAPLSSMASSLARMAGGNSANRDGTTDEGETGRPSAVSQEDSRNA